MLAARISTRRYRYETVSEIEGRPEAVQKAAQNIIEQYDPEGYGTMVLPKVEELAMGQIRVYVTRWNHCD